MGRFALILGLIGAVLAFEGGSAQAEPRYPIVVELYTSQGCNSCPPADAYLGSLKARRNIVALSFHVSYWDYLGWRDTFALEEGTARQQRYAQTLGERTIYTPQIVVGGLYHEVGSRHKAVDYAIRKIAVAQRGDDQENVSVAFREMPAGTLVVDIGEGRVFNRNVTIWLFVFDAYHEVRVKGGENGGRVLGYHNVVRQIRDLGEWYGKARSVSLDLAQLSQAGEGVAVVVQEKDSGRVLGAQQIQLAELPR